MTSQRIPITADEARHLTEFRAVLNRADAVEAHLVQQNEAMAERVVAAEARAEKAEALNRYLDDMLRSIDSTVTHFGARTIAKHALDRTDLADFLAREKTNV